MTTESITPRLKEIDPVTNEQIIALAKEHGAAYRNRHAEGLASYGFMEETLLAFARALLAAQPKPDSVHSASGAPSSAVPAGRWVPFEPTPEMLAPLIGHGLANLSDEDRVRALLKATGLYRRVLAAAPAAVPTQPAGSRNWSTGVRGGKPRFTVGVQSFTLDYDDSDGTAEWMRSMLEEALSRIASPPAQPAMPQDPVNAQLLAALKRLWKASEGASDEEISARLDARFAIAAAEQAQPAISDAALIERFVTDNEQFHLSAEHPAWLYCKDGDGNSTSLRGDLFAETLRQIIKGTP